MRRRSVFTCEATARTRHLGERNGEGAARSRLAVTPKSVPPATFLIGASDLESLALLSRTD